MAWEREFFRLGASVLATRKAALDFAEHGGLLPDGGRYDPVAIFVGELSYAAEMHLVLKEAGMLPAQRLARLASRILVLNASRSSCVSGGM
jgi:hypothetical protein